MDPCSLACFRVNRRQVVTLGRIGLEQPESGSPAGATERKEHRQEAWRACALLPHVQAPRPGGLPGAVAVDANQRAPRDTRPTVGWLLPSGRIRLRPSRGTSRTHLPWSDLRSDTCASRTGLPGRNRAGQETRSPIETARLPHQVVHVVKRSTGQDRPIAGSPVRAALRATR